MINYLFINIIIFDKFILLLIFIKFIIFF